MRRGRERSTLSERPCGLPLYSEFWEDLVASRCVTFAGTLERRLLTTGQVSRACPLRVRLQQRFRSLFGCLRLPLCVCPLSVECVLVCACVCVFVCLFHANRNATTVPIAATHLPSVCVPATPPNCLCPESAPPLRETATPLPLCCLSTPFCVCVSVRLCVALHFAYPWTLCWVRWFERSGAPSEIQINKVASGKLRSEWGSLPGETSVVRVQSLC
jgi:hypothetical protein